MGNSWISIASLWSVALLCPLALAPAPASAPDPVRQDAPGDTGEHTWRRKALVIGVSDYPQEAGWTQLPGAVRDARRVAELLVGHFGFDQSDVRLLLNEAATREGILDAFREHLIDGADENTLAVLFFAGHGSQMYDDGEDELEDRLDETIVPFDSVNEGEARKDIRDDELNALFAELTDRTPHVVGLFDCCHSGTVTRGGSLDVELDVVSRRAPRYVPPGVELTVVRNSQGQPLDLGGMKHKPLILTACLDHQQALESRREQRGLFSLALERALRGAEPSSSWGDVYRRVRSELRGMAGHRQTPVIDGPDQTQVFAGSFERPTSFPTTGCRVHRDEDDAKHWYVTVDAGYLHGFVENSLLSLAPDEDPDGSPLEARVVSAQVTECTAELLVPRTAEGLALRLPARSQLTALNEGKYGATLVEGPGRELALELRLDQNLGEDRERLVEFARSSPYFVLAGDDFDLHLGRGPDGYEAVDRFGDRILPHPIRLQPDQPAAARHDRKLLEDDLQAYARWDAVRKLQNHEGPLSRDIDVQLVPGWFQNARKVETFQEVPGLWEAGEHGEPRIRMDHEDQRRVTEPDGQCAVELTLTNHGMDPVHFVMFDVLPNWFVHKIGEVSGVLQPGESRVLRLGVNEEEDTVAGTAPEMLKFFFTAEPEDFRYVSSTGVRAPQRLQEPMLAEAARTRSAGRGGGRLGELLGAAMSGLRGAAPAPGSAIHWTSREVQFTVVPRGR